MLSASHAILGGGEVAEETRDKTHCQEQPRADTVDPDPGRGHDGEVLDKVDLGGLGDRVGQGAAARVDAGGRGRGDEGALGPVKVLFSSLHQPQVGLDVDVKAHVPVLFDGVICVTHIRVSQLIGS